jgi:hypothetical protein
MPINPMDIMKSQEASQLKYIDNHRNQQEQMQIGRNFQNLIRNEQAKTQQAAKSENTEYRYDAKEKGRNSYFGSGGERKQKEEENKKDTKGPTKSGGFDILI